MITTEATEAIAPKLLKKDLITLREYDPALDEGFVFQTWLKGLRYGNDLFEFISKEAYFTFYHRVIEMILERPNVKVIVSCLKDDPEVILGYAVVEGNVLHWAFTKQAWRRMGIMKDLVPKDLTAVTHVTYVGKSIMQQKYPKAVYNPFL